MISMSNSILPSASSAPEPHGNGPEVLILCNLLRMSRALGPRAPSAHARLGHGAPKQDGDEEPGTWLSPGTGLRGGKAANARCTAPGTAARISPGCSDPRTRGFTSMGHHPKV